MNTKIGATAIRGNSFSTGRSFCSGGKVTSSFLYLLAILLVLAAIAPVQAAVVNGGFETGAFPPWTSSGGTGVAMASFGTPPASGLYNALMETGPSVQSSIPTLETFLGVPSGALDSTVNQSPPGLPLTEGSAIRQTGVTVAAGNSITFAFNFLTSELSGVIDTAFYTLSSTSLTGAFFLADITTPNFPILGTPFTVETGYSTVSTGPLPAGTYTIGFGVADWGDAVGDSGLLIDDVMVVPEPAAWSLAVIGFVALLGYGRRGGRKTTS